MPRDPLDAEPLRTVTQEIIQVPKTKPEQHPFTLGQSTLTSGYEHRWMNEQRPFIFTCLHDFDNLECTIRTYPSEHSAKTRFLHLNKDDEMTLHNLFGTISYKGEGVYISQGKHVAPFISIFRYLPTQHVTDNDRKISAEKTKNDARLEQQCKNLLENNLIKILSDDKVWLNADGRITEYLIKSQSGSTNKIFYASKRPSILDAMGTP